MKNLKAKIIEILERGCNPTKPQHYSFVADQILSLIETPNNENMKTSKDKLGEQFSNFLESQGVELIDCTVKKSKKPMKILNKKPKDLREGQTISNFLDFLFLKGITDPFHIPDEELQNYYKEFLKQ